MDKWKKVFNREAETLFSSSNGRLMQMMGALIILLLRLGSFSTVARAFSKRFNFYTPVDKEEK